MKTQFILFSFFLVFLGAQKVLAQYPNIPKEIQDSADLEMVKFKERSDKAWQKALVVVEAEAKKGKPYVPWAAKPSDLPQATIPAFPGAEGGGKFSFGGRGGKVLVVANLNDD